MRGEQPPPLKLSTYGSISRVVVDGGGRKQPPPSKPSTYGLGFKSGGWWWWQKQPPPLKLSTYSEETHGKMTM